MSTSTSVILNASTTVIPSTMIQRAMILTNMSTESVEEVERAVAGGTIAVFREAPLWGMFNRQQQQWVEAEFDLKTCPVKVGDTIQVLQRNANFADIEVGTITKIGEVMGANSFQTVTIARPGGLIREEGWFFNRSNFRLVPDWNTRPAVPADEGLTGFDWEPTFTRAMEAVRGFSSGCTCDLCSAVRGGPDDLLRLMRYNVGSPWPSAGFSSAANEKKFAGELIRWARANLIERMLAPTRPVVAVTEPEPIPERVLEPTPVEVVEQPTVEVLTARVAELTTQAERRERGITSLLEEGTRLREWQRNALADFDKFGTTLLRNADDRGWCSEFDEYVQETNAVMTVLELPLRRREVEVEVRGNITVPFSLTVTVNIGRDEDPGEAAESLVNDDYSARTLLRDHTDPYSADIEIEECEVQ